MLLSGAADGLVLNYARGFCEPSLNFLDEQWRLLRLDLLDRGIEDLGPLARLSDSLHELSIQADPIATLDLTVFPELRVLSGEWAVLRGTLGGLTQLQRVVTWRFDEADLHAFRDHVELRQLTIKEAPYLESLSGVGGLSDLDALEIGLAPRLNEIDDLAGLASSLRTVELEGCTGIDALDDFEPLGHLRFLSVSNCGSVASLGPIASLQELEKFYAWGSTVVADGNLTPLTRLPALREVRMRDRRQYTPRVVEVSALLL